jgi:hypothetical protein
MIRQDDPQSWPRYIPAPEKNPMKMENTTVPAKLLTASIVIVMIPEPTEKKTIRMKTPNLGENKGGMVRPKILAPFKIVIWIMQVSRNRNVFFSEPPTE